jgi:uncharacterized protein YraI
MWCRPLFFLVVLTIPALSARGDGFPYVAYINSADVYVRSGPGRDYYPTEKLAKGVQVEVHRHDPGGWLAIRPPQGSFAWVSARHLDLDEGNLATVNSDRTVARVGSSFSDVRDVIQVRLDRDEKVELLETPESDSPWCKIAPPAGEFRWVFSKYVDRQLPSDLAQDEHDARNSDTLVARDRAAQHEEGDLAGDRVRLTAGNDRIEPAVGSTAAQSPAEPEFAGDLARLRELERIDMELSEVVAGDISQWSFAELQPRAELALRAAQSSLERGRARVLLDKLVRFEEIKRRHDSLRNGPVASAPAPAVATIAIPGPRDPRYDGVGKLLPVVTQKTGGPQYALFDPTGAVLSFVTPAPGVNLRPYVDKNVGVNGQRGYLPELQRQHVSVQRVTLLDVQRR